MSTHSAECLAQQREHSGRIAAFEMQYPHYCRTCNGQGEIHWSENQAPLGSGRYWPEEMQDVCDDCVGRYRCPRCGKSRVPFYQQALADIHWWEDRRWNALNEWLKARNKQWGIAVRPISRDNWREKIAYVFGRWLQRTISDIVPFPTYADPQTDCPHCGWPNGASLPAPYECNCWVKEEYA